MTELGFVIKEKLADTETPVSAYLKVCGGRADSFLLESAETHESIGRYSIIAFDPVKLIELGLDEVRISNGDEARSFPSSDFFSVIRRTVREMAGPVPPGLPAVGSLMGFIGYDAVRLIERLGPPRTRDLPIARLVFPSCYLVFDHRRRTMILVALGPDESSGREKIREIESLLRRPLDLETSPKSFEMTGPDRGHFIEAVKQAKEYIRAGDIYQVVLADRFEGRTEVKPMEVYRRLRVKSPSPYMFFLDFGRFQILGASPETMVKVQGGKVLIRPIAGTRGRSDDPEEDRALEEELRASEKERAEHIMLVDLGRNDVGRVSRYGTVMVSPFMTVERYSHVMHLVSQVQGRLEERADAVDAFMAGFPAGTVSGAPKVRAMEIIDQLERRPRGPYAGAVGYFGPNQEMDTCIAIRLLVFQGDRFSIPVGAGIVADSIPEMEFKEIQDKAAQSLAALEAAAEGSL